MGDYDHIGKAFEAMYLAARAGAIAIVILLVLGVFGGGWVIWWLFHHVTIN